MDSSTAAATVPCWQSSASCVGCIASVTAIIHCVEGIGVEEEHCDLYTAGAGIVIRILRL
jgi:hypothetical protein